MIQSLYSIDESVRLLLFAAMLSLWISPWFLVIFFHGDLRIDYKLLCEHTECLNANQEAGQSADEPDGQHVGRVADESVGRSADDRNVGMPDIFRFWQLYVLFAITGIVTGAASCFMQNTPQIVESISSDSVHNDENSKVSTTLVAIVSRGTTCCKRPCRLRLPISSMFQSS